MFINPMLSSPVGVFPRPENCVFVPVPVELRFHDAERSGREYIPFMDEPPNPDIDILKSIS